jgi:hypothetical protein
LVVLAAAIVVAVASEAVAVSEASEEVPEAEAERVEAGKKTEAVLWGSLFLCLSQG